MAKVFEPTKKDQREWERWVKRRPPKVRAVAERFDMWTLYRLKTTGQRVVIYSYVDSDPVTLTVLVLAQFNAVLFETRVFGIDPDDLVECDLPGPDEVVGAAMTQDEVEDNIDALRVMKRPDLWTMGEDGKARRKN